MSVIRWLENLLPLQAVIRFIAILMAGRVLFTLPFVLQNSEGDDQSTIV